MNKNCENILEGLIKRIPELCVCKADIVQSFELLIKCFRSGGKLLIAGNGGSCADAEHIAGELMKGFMKKRELSKDLQAELVKVDNEIGSVLSKKLQRGVPVISLSNHQGLNTAFNNDVENGGECTFAQQVGVYGNKNDVFLGISTSGNSKNILMAAVVARAKKLSVISLTGEKGGRLASFADVSIKAPSNETYLVQEYHLPIYHCLCLMIEEELF